MFNGTVASKCTPVLTIRTTYGCGREMWPKCQHRTYDAVFMYTKPTCLQICTALSVTVASFWSCSFNIDKNFRNSYVSLLPDSLLSDRLQGMADRLQGMAYWHPAVCISRSECSQHALSNPHIQLSGGSTLYQATFFVGSTAILRLACQRSVQEGNERPVRSATTRNPGTL